MATDGYQTMATNGYQAVTMEGYQAVTTEGYQAVTTEGYQAVTTEGYQAATTEEFQAATTEGYQTSASDGYHTAVGDGCQIQTTNEQQTEATEEQQTEASEEQQNEAIEEQQTEETDAQEPMEPDEHSIVRDRLRQFVVLRTSTDYRDQIHVQNAMSSYMSTNPIADEYLLQILPTFEEYRYKVESCKPIPGEEQFETTEHFEAVFIVTIHSREQFDEWKQRFEDKTHTQYTIMRTKLGEGERIIFKQYLKCLHNSRYGKIGKRNFTACSARLTVTLSNNPAASSKDSDMKGCRIELYWTHNHPNLATDFLHRHRVNTNTDGKLIQLYRHGHTPTSALRYIRTEIQDNLGEGECLEIAMANRSICPDYKHAQYIFKRHFKKAFGGVCESDIWNRLSAAQAKYIELMRTKIDCHSEHSPTKLLAAYEFAISKLEAIKTTNAAVSYLHAAGKYSEASCAKKKKLEIVPAPQAPAVPARKGRPPGPPGSQKQRKKATKDKSVNRKEVRVCHPHITTLTNMQHW